MISRIIICIFYSNLLFVLESINFFYVNVTPPFLFWRWKHGVGHMFKVKRVNPNWHRLCKLVISIDWVIDCESSHQIQLLGKLMIITGLAISWKILLIRLFFLNLNFIIYNCWLFIDSLHKKCSDNDIQSENEQQMSIEMQVLLHFTAW